MTPELYQRLKPLYAAALDIPKEQRAAYVAEACRGEAELQEHLEDLLASNDLGDDTLDTPLVDFKRATYANEDGLEEGTLLLDRFEIIRHLGSGGMGDVYEARDLVLEPAHIALKTIRPSIAQNPAILARFKEEVKLARQVNGPNICRIYELYVPPAAGGPWVAFLTMEFLEGVTLADRLAADGPVDPKAALAIATQLCAALQSIHDAGVVHRDLKPRNVMLVPRNGSEQVFVMDFGLARALATEAPTIETGVTAPGLIMGTPAYMAPEQFEPGGKVSPATDIYALGIVLYELITGEQPFAAPTPLSAAVRRARQPESPSSIRKGVPPVWDDVISRCIEYEPARRYQSAGEVLAALHRHAFIVRFPRGLRIVLSRRLALVAACVALLFAAGGGWRLYQASRIQTLSPEGQRWYNRGMMALRDGTYLQAIKDFQEVVLQDKNYALTHARLADAWAELDFTGKAEGEILQAAAPEAQNTMPELGREYVDAIRRTLIRDYSAATQDYEEILRKLPDDQKADGFVDLGRAYEKAGRIKQTIASYEQAARMKPDDPAPFVHLGILKSRQRDAAGAESAFSRAEALYQAESNLEGLAEVAYQRGYAAVEVADSVRAHEYLDKSLAIARQIDSPQLEARTLTQLSSVEYNDSKDDQAIADANQAIQIAIGNNLEYWSADGLMRLGNAYLDKMDFAKAEAYSQQALSLARSNQHPRIEADAELTLASIRDQEGGKWDEQIAFAKSALQYDLDFGFMTAAASASELVARGEQGKGDLVEALQSGNRLLDVAARTRSQAAMERAEGLVGDISSQLGDYPTALRHYQNAMTVGVALHRDEEYQAFRCADVLWRLGRYDEAEEMLASIPPSARKRADIGARIEEVRAQMQLSRNLYFQALQISRNALRTYPSLAPGESAVLLSTQAIAEGRLGQADRAQLDNNRSLELARKENDESVIAYVELAQAEVFLQSHFPEQARSCVRAANAYFARKGQKESEWQGLLYLAQATKSLGDNEESSELAKKALDILGGLEQSWSPAVFDKYSKRPDYQLAIKQLLLIKEERGTSPHDRAPGY